MSDVWVGEDSETLEEAIYMFEERAAAVERRIDALGEQTGTAEKWVVEVEKSSGAVPPSMNTSAWQARNGVMRARTRLL